MTTTNTETSIFNWPGILQRIRDGSDRAVSEMYTELEGFRFYFRQKMGPQDADDAYHEMICDLVAQIRQDCVRDPLSVVCYAKTIARRKVVAWIDERTQARRNKDSTESVWISDSGVSPEIAAIEREQNAIARNILLAFKPRDRTVLIRYYLKKESAEKAAPRAPTSFRSTSGAQIYLDSTAMVLYALRRGRVV